MNKNPEICTGQCSRFQQQFFDLKLRDPAELLRECWLCPPKENSSWMFVKQLTRKVLFSSQLIIASVICVYCKPKSNLFFFFILLLFFIFFFRRWDKWMPKNRGGKNLRSTQPSVFSHFLAWKNRWAGRRMRTSTPIHYLPHHIQIMDVSLRYYNYCYLWLSWGHFKSHCHCK